MGGQDRPEVHRGEGHQASRPHPTNREDGRDAQQADHVRAAQSEYKLHQQDLQPGRPEEPAHIEHRQEQHLTAHWSGTGEQHPGGAVGVLQPDRKAERCVKLSFHSCGVK